jgi:uncharacterized protein (DUF2141 family)
MTNRKRACITVLALFMVFALLPPFTAAADTIDNIIAEMEEIYQYIDEGDKAAIQNARSEIQGLGDLDPYHQDWEAIFGIGTDNNLITPEVIAAFGGEPAARDAAKSFAAGLSEIYYTSDSAYMAQRLEEFRENHRGTFHTLFGSEVTVDILYDFLIAAKNELPEVIASNPDDYVKNLAYGSNQELIDTMPNVLRDAMQNVLAEADPASGIGILNGKLGAIGWSMSKLIEQQKVIGDLIDPDLAARVAVAKALVRSQTELYIYENETETLQPKDANKEIHLTQDAGSAVEYRLKIMGREASTLVDFSSSDPSVATVEYTEGQGYPVTKAMGAGTATIYAYRDFTGAQPEADWILKFTVNVQSVNNLTGSVLLGARGDSSTGKHGGITVTVLELQVSSTSDEQGNFEMNLPEGTYTLEICKNGFLKRQIPITIVKDQLTVVPPVTLVAGDINGDGYVDISDLGMLADSYGSQSGAPQYSEHADFNADGFIELSDLGILADTYGKYWEDFN